MRLLKADGILRVRGPPTHAPFELDVNHPIFVPQTLHFTELVICQQHAKILDLITPWHRSAEIFG